MSCKYSKINFFYGEVTLNKQECEVQGVEFISRALDYFLKGIQRSSQKDEMSKFSEALDYVLEQLDITLESLSRSFQMVRNELEPMYQRHLLPWFERAMGYRVMAMFYPSTALA